MVEHPTREDPYTKYHHPDDNEIERRFSKGKTFPTKKGIYVKSYGEQRIADFLFDQKIEFTYDILKKFDEDDYGNSDYAKWLWARPDFQIKDKPIVIEYWGMQYDRDGNIRYEEDRDRKINLYDQEGFILIEVYTGHLKDLENYLCHNLRKAFNKEKETPEKIAVLQKPIKDDFVEQFMECETLLNNEDEFLKNRDRSTAICKIIIEGLSYDQIKEKLIHTLVIFENNGYVELKKQIKLRDNVISIVGEGQDGRCAFCGYFRKCICGEFANTNSKGEIILKNCPFNPEEKRMNFTLEGQHDKEKLKSLFRGNLK